MKKSITVRERLPIDCAYIIKNVNVDRITVEKYEVECRSNIENAWETSQGDGDQILEVMLKDKITDITLKAKGNVIEIAAKSGGKIVKDIVVEKTKKGKITYLTGFEFFKDATGDGKKL